MHASQNTRDRREAGLFCPECDRQRDVLSGSGGPGHASFDERATYVEKSDDHDQS